MADGKLNTKAKQSRADRLAAAAKARRRKHIQLRVAIAAGVALAVAVVAIVFVNDRRERNELKSKLQAGSCVSDGRSDTDHGPGRNHVPAPIYKVDPPAGGDHLITAAPAGRYTSDTVLPDGQLVHSMEHGYVVLWVRPDADETITKAVDELFDRHSRDVLVVPRPSLKTPVAATAWGHRLLCQAADAQALDLFVNTFANKGPEAVPHR